MKYLDGFKDAQRPSSRRMSSGYLDGLFSGVIAPFDSIPYRRGGGGLHMSYTPSTSVSVDYSTEELPGRNQQNSNHELLPNHVCNVDDNVRVIRYRPCLDDDGLPSVIRCECYAPDKAARLTGTR